jgi:hypothetical protein
MTEVDGPFPIKIDLANWTPAKVREAIHSKFQFEENQETTMTKKDRTVQEILDEDFKGKTFKNVEEYSDELIFTREDGEIFSFLHKNECCERVWIEDIDGDLNDLIGSPLLLAEESVNTPEANKDKPEKGDLCYSTTWTFYRFSTIKGWATIRWCGTSTGYYSESVQLYYRGNEND